MIILISLGELQINPLIIISRIFHVETEMVFIHMIFMFYISSP